MVSLQSDLVLRRKGSRNASLVFLFLLFFSSWSIGSPSSSDSRQNSHQNIARNNLFPVIPNFIECAGRAPSPSWRNWPEGVDSARYIRLKQLCTPIEPPSLGFVCPLPVGPPLQDHRYVSDDNLLTWPLIKICQERCWCKQPNDPDFSEDEAGFSGESEADMESESESELDDDLSDHGYSDYSGSGDSMYDIASDAESIYNAGGDRGDGDRRQQHDSGLSLPKQCSPAYGKRCRGGLIDYPILPSKCGQRCYSVTQRCNPVRAGKMPCKCTAQYFGEKGPSPIMKWIATCLRPHTRAFVPRGRVEDGLRKRFHVPDEDEEDLDLEHAGAGAGAGAPPLTPTLACPCNASYVSQACCQTTDGLVWESPEMYLGQLDLDVDGDMDMDMDIDLDMDINAELL